MAKGTYNVLQVKNVKNESPVDTHSRIKDVLQHTQNTTHDLEVAIPTSAGYACFRSSKPAHFTALQQS
jgi:hypothetical protein